MIASPSDFRKRGQSDPEADCSARRNSADPSVKSALAIWDDVCGPRADRAYTEATRLREELRHSGRHQAYAWVTATCGRIDAYRGHSARANALLAEAYGLFFIADDRYGMEMVSSHLALPQVWQGNLDRAIELALGPLNSGVRFNDLDRSLLHGIAAICYSERREFHGAVFQLNQQYELVKNFGDYVRAIVVVGNLGTVLLQVGAWELSLAASSEAWKLQLENCRVSSEMQFTFLANVIHANTQLGRLGQARERAQELVCYLAQQRVPAHWIMHTDLAILFARLGDVASATRHLEKAQELAAGYDAFHRFETVGFHLLEAEGRHYEVISSVQAHLMRYLDQLLIGERINLASLLQRSCKALGNDYEARRWQQFEEESSKSVLLSDMLISQIRSTLNVQKPIASLTERELTCLRLSAHGQTSADIGLKLGLKTRTVNFHFGNILRKLNAMNRQEAIAKAVSSNLLKRD